VRRIAWPCGLTDREVEVIRLVARGSLDARGTLAAGSRRRT
jgi:hypothetical protein